MSSRLEYNRVMFLEHDICYLSAIVRAKGVAIGYVLQVVGEASKLTGLGVFSVS